jgi:hypothetical protein
MFKKNGILTGLFRNYKRSAFVIFFFFLFSCTTASKVALVSFDRKINLANYIVLCKVTEIKIRILGQNIAVINTIKQVKGSLLDEKIEIKYGNFFFNYQHQKNKFVVGNSYVLFLIKEKSDLKVLGGFQGYYPISKDGFLVNDANETISVDMFLSGIIDAD